MQNGEKLVANTGSYGPMSDNAQYVKSADEVDIFLLEAQVHASNSANPNDFADVFAIIQRARRANGGNWRNLYPTSPSQAQHTPSSA